MNKYKFEVSCSGDELDALLRTIRKLPTNTEITNSVEELIRNAVHNNDMESMVYIFFNPNARWAEDVLEYCFHRYYFIHDDETADYEWVQNVQAFISSNGLLTEVSQVSMNDRFSNAIFHVNGEYECRAVLLRLKETGKISDEEYLSCFPSGDENRYLSHKTIYLTNGVVSFDTRKLSHRMDASLPEPFIFNMDEFLGECTVRPHARLMREWLDDPTMQIEMQHDDGSWSIIQQPCWVADCKYRRYVEAKSPVELKVVSILSQLTTDERAELKRQLGVS